jgi:hypothetical protein
LTVTTSGVSFGMRNSNTMIEEAEDRGLPPREDTRRLLLSFALCSVNASDKIDVSTERATFPDIAAFVAVPDKADTGQ